MKNALYDATGILLAQGFADFHPEPGQYVLPVPEDFTLKPLENRWNGTIHEPVAAAPPAQRQETVADLKAALIAKGVISQADVTAAEALKP